MHTHLIKHSLDILGSIFALISTLYYIKADKLAWPIGLVAICINGILYFQTGIYGDMSLEGIYFVSTFYGWYQWSRGGNNHAELEITHLTKNNAFLLTTIAVISISNPAYTLIHFTNSQVPYWDATTTVLSLVAQWLICKKIIECWIMWFIVDALYVGLYIYKGIPAHSVLLIIYLGLAVAGYIRWYRLMKKESNYSDPVIPDIRNA